MAMNWQAGGEGPAHGGYAAWEAAAEAAQGGADRLVPVLARLVPPPGGGMDLAGAIAATLALPGVDFARHERDLLETERAQAGAGWPAYQVRLVAYAPRALLAAPPPFWQVLRLGPGLRPGEAPPPPEPPRDLCRLAGRLSPDVPVMAVIDEGIGYLNARFRAAPDRTRFLGVWLMADERRPQGPVGPWGDIRLGRVLTGAEIDAQLAAGGTEADQYAQVNRALYPPPVRAATAQRVGHGTHVLDLACGAGMAEPMARVPILAVQLPPASIRESAGRRMEAHLVQGLRWILAEVLRLSDGNRVPPVVVNLSIGSLAGPGDATEFLAEWIGHEIDRHSRLAPGAEVRITGAYGNARLSRLAARAEARIGRPMVLDWRLLPDDGTASFLEIRVDAAMAPGLALAVQPPPGSGLPPLTVTWPAAPGCWWLHDGGRGPVGLASFEVEKGGQALCLLALAPSCPDPRAARAAPGLWRIEVATKVNEPVRVIARVQRDDTPMGHAPAGRQSWLDHREGWGWDPELRSYVQPLPQAGCPVTPQGTAVAYAGIELPQVYVVGALRPAGAGWRPSAFSAEGAQVLRRPGESAGPSLSAPGEAGPVLGGIAASGILTGSRVRMAGTSMAAPAVARRLLEMFRAAPPRDLAAEHAALVGAGNWTTAPDPRRGHGVLI
jgi:hypothetical protein